MSHLPHLAPGDAVSVVAPAGPVEAPRLRRGLEALRSMGLVPRPAPHLDSVSGFLAGKDSDRAADLTAAMADPSTKGVFYARGGYGTSRLLPQLDLESMAASGKLLLGYSDATALGLALSRQRPFAFLYGPTICGLGAEEPAHDQESLQRGLFGTHSEQTQELVDLEIVQGGRVRGPVMGGCLSLIASLLGTPFEPSLEGVILFLEEVNEEPYRIDRLLTQLAISGRLQGLAGMLVGQLTECESRDKSRPSPAALEVVAGFADQVRGPVLAGLPVGHGPGAVTMPLGVEAELDGGSGTVRLRHR